MDNIQKIGYRLRKYREYLNLTQTEFANKIDFSSNTVISRFENNNSVPSVETLEKIFNSFPDIDLHWLITGKFAPNTNEFQQFLKNIEINASGESLAKNIIAVELQKDKIGQLMIGKGPELTDKQKEDIKEFLCNLNNLQGQLLEQMKAISALSENLIKDK